MIKYEENENIIELDEYELYIEKALLESEDTDKYYTFEEFDKEMRKILDE